MSRRIVDIPLGLMRTINCNWDIDWGSQSAGLGVDSSEQVFSNRFPRWLGTPSLRLHGNLINFWRALRGETQGRIGIYRVPMVDLDDMPVTYGSAGIPFDDGSTFDDGTGFAYTPTVTVAADAAAGAEQISIVETDQPVRIGQFISCEDWPYLVTRRDVVSGGIRIGVQMPLRRAIPAGTAISLRATGLFQATEDTMGNPAYGLVKVSTVDLSFREWLNRP